jgi:hypothetical protein
LEEAYDHHERNATTGEIDDSRCFLINRNLIRLLIMVDRSLIEERPLRSGIFFSVYALSPLLGNRPRLLVRYPQVSLRPSVLLGLLLAVPVNIALYALSRAVM